MATKEQERSQSQSRSQDAKEQESQQSRQQESQDQEQPQESAREQQVSALLQTATQGVPEAGLATPETVQLPVSPEDIAQEQTQVMEAHVDEPGGSRRTEVSQVLWALDNDSRIEDRNGNSLLRPSASVTNLVSEES
jgi:hypothetical protein